MSEEPAATRDPSPQEPEPRESGAPASLAARLGQSHVGVRRDLLVTRHVFRGQPAYLIKDPLTFQTHGLTLEDYEVFIRIRAERSLGQQFEELVSERVLSREDEDRFYAFVVSLHKRNFLHLPIADERRLYQRWSALQRSRAARSWLNLLFFRLELFNPDDFLERTAHRVRPFFARWAFLVWLAAVLVGLGLAVANARELARPLSQVLLLRNLPLLWLTLVVLKAVHELGHAYACKLLGGEVPEIGVNFIVGTPLPYVDASAAWGFPRKRDRLIVSLAGMYVELFVAAVAILLWSVSGPGLLRAVAYNAALLASVVTVGFNLNPLMKFDGYYVLSDLVEVPNLRRRSTDHVKAVLKRVFLGLPLPADGPVSGVRPALFGFGVASAVYRVTVVLAISATIATKYFIVGVALAAAYVLSESARVVGALWKLFFRSDETAHARVRAALVGALLLVAMPAGVCLVPLPARVLAPALVSSRNETVVRAEAAGFVATLFAQPSQMVEEGAPLVFLEHSLDEGALLEAKGRLELARMQLEALRYQDFVVARLEELRADHIEREVAWYQREDERRRIHAPLAGRLVRFLDETDRGRYVRAGEPVATVSAGTTVARVLLNEHQMAEAEPRLGQTVLFRALAQPEQSLDGRIVSIGPAGRRMIEDVLLTHVAGGNIVVDPRTGEAREAYFELVVELPGLGAAQLPHGATGRAQLAASTEPLGRLLWRRVLRFLQHLQRQR